MDRQRIVRAVQIAGLAAVLVFVFWICLPPSTAHAEDLNPPPRGLRAKALAHARFMALANPAASEGTDGLDVTSRRCLACHDGAVAPASDVDFESAPGIGGPLRSHPIGVPYPTRRRRFSDNQYVPRERLDARIILPEGKLGCLSCHSFYGGEEKLLVMSNRGSRLCFACHEI